jgi:hypothetical protein
LADGIVAEQKSPALCWWQPMAVQRARQDHTCSQTAIRADGEVVELAPGMSVHSGDQTGTRRVLWLLLDSLAEIRLNSFHERQQTSARLRKSRGLNMTFLKLLIPRLVIANILFAFVYYGLAVGIISENLRTQITATSTELFLDFLLKMNIMLFACWTVCFLLFYFSSGNNNRNTKIASTFSDVFCVIPPIAITYMPLITGRAFGLNSYADSAGDIVTSGFLTTYGYDLYQRLAVDVTFFAFAYVTLSFLTDRSRALWGSEQ